MTDLDALASEARANGGLVTTAQARACGLSGQRLTELVRGGTIARVARGVYVLGSTRVTHDPAAVAASWNVVLSYDAAAAWWGVDLPSAPEQLHVTAARNRGRLAEPVEGIRLHRADLHAHDICLVRGVRVTSPLRTALDVARHASLERAVAIVDAFMRARLLSAGEFDRACRRAKGPGRRRMQLVARLVDPSSGSILESLCRILLWRNHVAPEATQFAFRDPAGWRGRLDFAWPSLRAALECDGYEFHAERASFHRDRRRWSALNRNGWRSGVVTWFDVTGDPAYVVGLVRDLLAGAAGLPAHKGDCRVA